MTSWSASLLWGVEGLATEVCGSVPVGDFNSLDCKGAALGMRLNSATSCDCGQDTYPPQDPVSFRDNFLIRVLGGLNKIKNSQ